MRESNAHLRRENEELASRVTAANEQVKVLKDSAAPVEQESRKAKAEIEALQQTNTQLSQDASYWRDRWVTPHYVLLSFLRLYFCLFDSPVT